MIRRLLARIWHAFVLVRVPPPTPDSENELQAQLNDQWFPEREEDEHEPM